MGYIAFLLPGLGSVPTPDPPKARRNGKVSFEKHNVFVVFFLKKPNLAQRRSGWGLGAAGKDFMGLGFCAGLGLRVAAALHPVATTKPRSDDLRSPHPQVKGSGSVSRRNPWPVARTKPQTHKILPRRH